MKYLSIVSLLVILATSACKHKEEHKEEAATFTVTNPIQKDTTINHDYVCQIRSIQHIELRALEKGYLESVYVDEGQSVRKGQLLFRIMPIIYEAEAQKAKAELSFAEIEYQNTKALSDSNIVSKSELALTRAKVEKAKAEYNLAKAHLGFTEIRAPFDGIIGRFNEVRKGSLLDEGELLTTISDNSKMWVYFNVSESEYYNYITSKNPEKASVVKLQMANNELYALDGKIETIEADFNNETGNIAFRATFANPNRILRHGTTGNILMPNPIKNALLIPQEATFEVLDKKYVYAVDAEGKVTAKEITVVNEMPHLYAVSHGISADDKILVEGIRKVKNGDKIHFQVKSLDAILNHLVGLKAE